MSFSSLASQRQLLSGVIWVPPIQRSMPRSSTRSASPRSASFPLAVKRSGSRAKSWLSLSGGGGEVVRRRRFRGASSFPARARTGPGRTRCRRGRAPARAACAAAQRLEQAPFLGDTWFYRALSALGQGTTRLLETDDGAPLPPPPPLSDNQLFARLPLRLTASGRTRFAAKPTESNSSASTAGSAAPRSRQTTAGAGTLTS